jgi:putative DNA primase/helicase
VQPSQFDNKFQRAHLHGKLANLITEIAEGTVIADAQLKAIVSGELTTAEHKMKQPFDFRPFATCWFGTNHMPHTRDFSDALFRRATVLEFPNVFKGDNCDPHLKDKLLDELPGILNLALKAIGSVIQRGTFMTCESNEQAKAAWRMEADQVAQFIEDECKIDVDASTNVSILYNRYKKWVMDSGIKHKVTKRTFSDRLDTLGFPSSRGSKGVRVKKGIRLKSYMHEEKAIIRQAIDEHSGTE